jgi:hypothetical protein
MSRRRLPAINYKMMNGSFPGATTTILALIFTNPTKF